jgi:hypothetical protein
MSGLPTQIFIVDTNFMLWARATCMGCCVHVLDVYSILSQAGVQLEVDLKLRLVYCQC